MGSLDYMPEVQKHLISEGALFPKHYCTSLLRLSPFTCSLTNILQLLYAAQVE